MPEIVHGTRLKRFLIAVLLAAGATGLRYGFNASLGFRSPLLFHILAVALAAQIAGTVSGLVTTGLSVLLIDYFFIPPYHSIGPPPDRGDHMALVLFTAVGVIVSVFGGWQQRSKEALKRLHQRLALNHDIARIGTFEWSIRDNRNVWTPELCHLYGIDPKEFDGTMEAWKRLVNAEDAEAVMSAIEAATSTGQPVLDYEFRATRNGETRWLHGRSHFTYSADGHAESMTGVNIDITEQKRTEEALRQTNAQLEAILESIPEPMMVTDANGNVLRVNDVFKKTILYENKIDNYIPHVDLLTEDGLLVPPEQWPINRVLRGEKFNATDFIMSIDGVRSNRRFSGTPVYDDNGKLTHAVLTLFDITDQKRMAQELQRINDTMSLAFEAGSSGGWAWDLETGELFWTQSYYRLLGVDPAVKPSPELFDSLVHPKDLTRLKKNLDDAMQGRVDDFSMEFRVLNGDRVRWFERRGRVRRDQDGKVAQLVGISTDVTERKILRGLLPTCARCKKIRDEHDQWHIIERYITEHSEARFTHGLCPDCLEDYAKASGIQGLP